jgi:Zn-finger nucleic acid-binding protein
MTVDERIEITCPTCRHVWHEQLSELERIDQEMFRSPTPGKRVEQYRARCPLDHTYVIVDVLIEEAEDG